MTSTMAAGSQARRPVAYARISEDRDGRSIGAREQLTQIRALAERLGLPEPVEIMDNDLSAFSGRTRPGYAQLCRGLKAEVWDTLLVWHPDRLHRRTAELEPFMDLVLDHQISIHTVRAGDDWDIESPDGQMMAKMQGAIAERESRHKAARLSSRARRSLALGQDVGGPRRFGWNDDRKTARPAEKAIVRELTLRVAAGDSLNALAAEMNAREVPLLRHEYLIKKRGKLRAAIETETDADTRDSIRERLAQTEEKIKFYRGEWTATLVSALVRRPRNCGLQPRITRDRRKKVLSRDYIPGVIGEWEPLVSRAEWDAAQLVFSGEGRRKKLRRGAQLLTGLAYCGACHATVTIVASSKKHDYSNYGCRKCHKISRNSELCDSLVLGAIEYALDSGLEIKAHEPGALAGDDFMAREDALKAERDDLERIYKRRPTAANRAALDEGNAAIARELADLRERGIADRPRPSRGVTGRMFRKMPTDKQRPVIAELCEITILPARRGSVAFDPSRIRIVPVDDEHGAAFDAAVARIGQEVAAIDRSRRSSVRAPQKRHEITCAVCGKTVMTGNSRGRYCSQKCRYEGGKAGLAAGPWERDKERTCEMCGKAFMAAKQTARFCSQACASENHRNRVADGTAVPMDKVLTRRCVMCRETFRTAKADAMYCSAKCRAASVRDRRRGGQPPKAPDRVKAVHPRTCDVCGKEYKSAKRDGAAYCTPNCRAKAYYRANRADVLAKVKARAAR